MSWTFRASGESLGKISADYIVKWTYEVVNIPQIIHAVRDKRAARVKALHSDDL